MLVKLCYESYTVHYGVKPAMVDTGEPNVSDLRYSAMPNLCRLLSVMGQCQQLWLFHFFKNRAVERAGTAQERSSQEGT